MKIFILNHCSHNKGDNSVLYYLTKCLDMVSTNNEITVSCSDGKSPFWANESVKSVYWPGGKIFKTPEVGFIKNAIRRIKFMMMRKIFYKLFLYCYANKYDKFAKILASLFFNSQLISAFKNVDKVICTGGHHISNVLEKDCINPQLVSLALADLYGHQTVMWSQSIGPIDTATNYSKIAMGRVFDSCSQIFVRDDLSEKCVKNTSGAKTIKAPDSVFLSNKLVSDFVKNINKPYVCCAVYTAGIADEAYLGSYKKSWISIAEGLIAKGFDVIFIPMQYKGFGGDERGFLNEVISELAGDCVSFIDEDKSPKDTLELFKGASFIIGHKTHSVIYGLALEIPTIAIAYHEKTRYFMGLFGLEDFVYQDVISNETYIVEKISAETADYQKSVHASLDKSALFAEQLVTNLKYSIYDL
ncbi:polysaccharide pyruvyl transferase family protein [Cognaticolwellia aestuarii]|uniref:polysaccharide pyruvyl transferase family protein n=1 Tax=Cognaticolwellia aestuarii TaxID=329993 RepID=UPI0009857103|nr:polysaccharide pyruvyl transferase family protein [Cognaticolwellia aestuarii]